MESKEIIEKIIIQRKKLGYSQRELAKITGLKQPAIARIESFKNIPNLDTLLKLLSSLNLSLTIK